MIMQGRCGWLGTLLDYLHGYESQSPTNYNAAIGLKFVTQRHREACSEAVPPTGCRIKHIGGSSVSGIG